MKVIILGSGSAYGCPNVFNEWGDIKDKQNPKNYRTRSSTLIEIDGKGFLVDMAPEYLQQINKNNIKNLDCVFLTHGHYDHIAAVPELWRTSHVLQKKINVFCYEQTYQEIRNSFSYLFKPHKEPGSNGLVWNVLKEKDEFSFDGIKWQTFQVKHKNISTTVFRHEDFAIVMDVEALSADDLLELKGLRLLVLECNNGTEVIENGHNNLPQTFKWLEEIKPQKTVLTHISIRVGHDELSKLLPQNVCVAYDGMIIE